jgi:hypothetical protein
MWARQEYSKGSFQVEYLATADMPADGLTKALSRQKFEHFRALLNLQDTRHITSMSKGEDKEDFRHKATPDGTQKENSDKAHTSARKPWAAVP